MSVAQEKRSNTCSYESVGVMLCECRIRKQPHRQGDSHLRFMYKSKRLIWIRSDRVGADGLLADEAGKQERKWVEDR